jgi:OFA family oxalate/formate antiporter-like MFS transporter
VECLRKLRCASAKDANQEDLNKGAGKLYQGWKVTMAGFGINFLVGISYTWSIFGAGLSRERGWTQAEAALPYTVYIFSYAILMIAAGRFQDRMGPGITATLGGVFVGSAFIVSSFISAPVALALCWGLLFGIGQACCFGTATPAAVKWFPPQRRGFITGVVVTGIGVSALFLAPMADALVRARGVAGSFLISGVLLTTGIVFLARFLSIPVRNGRKSADTTGDWRRVFGYSQVYLLWLMFFLTTAAGITFATHLTRISAVHASFERGYIMVTFFALFNGAGRIAAGLLSDFLGRSRAMNLVFGVMTLAMVATLSAKTAWSLGLVTSVLGLSYGGVFSLFPAATLSYFGEDNFGFNYGLVFSGVALAGVFSLAAGYLFDIHGDFYLSFTLLALFCAAATAMSFFLKAPGPASLPVVAGRAEKI